MGCQCTNRWTKWTTTGDGELAMLEVQSRCEPVKVIVVQRPDGDVDLQPPTGFGHDTIRTAEGHASDPTGVPAASQCKVTYVLKNYFGVDFAITSFSTGADTYVFSPPVGAGQSKTIQASSSLGVAAECYTARTGVLELAHTGTAARLTLGDVRICRLREVE